MAKGKKKGSEEPKGKKISLKMAKSCLRLTVDGKRRLDLSNMEIAAFPKCLLKLSDVDELDLSRNFLRKLPDYIDEFVNLRFLDLHSNYLEQVPEAIGRLQNLVTLNLNNNQLTSISLPNEMGLLKKLKTLNLGMNQLDKLPSFVLALKELRRIGLFNNQLTTVPDCLQTLSLESINIKDNPFPDSKRARKPTSRVECLYLVHESCLCKECIQRCTEERQRLEGRGSGNPVSNRRSMLVGLMAPNSVAQVDQATWR
ncbi:leucine-rich repeat-containing protein 18 [Aplochiton taeniatus]